MKEALYSVYFLSNNGLGGCGVVVLKEGKVLGGDSSYTYVGTYRKIDNNYSKAEIVCKKFSSIHTSIFGNEDIFTLVITFKEGKEENPDFSGYMKGREQDEIKGKLKLEEAFY